MPQQLLDDAARTRLSRRLAEFEVGGVSRTVLLAEAGIPIVQHCLGLADRACGTLITAATRFQTASVTKMLTATAVLDQVTHGRVTVGTPVVEVVPPDRRPRDLTADVTVHHLLCHTSGIADYFEEDESLPNAGADYGALWRDRAAQGRAGMDDSGFDRSDEPRAGSVVHYLPSRRTNVHSVPVVGGGDGGCVCTAADLVRFCRALADGTPAR